MESCRLAELKYAIFSGIGRKTKKLRCSKLFVSTVSKNGFLEGSTFLFQYSSITRTPLESSRLGGQIYAISAGQDVILKNEHSKVQKMTLCDERTWSLQYGLPEESTFILRYSYSRHTPLDSSRLGEQKYAVSTRQHITLKNNSFRKGKFQRETAIG